MGVVANVRRIVPPQVDSLFVLLENVDNLTLFRSACPNEELEETQKIFENNQAALSNHADRRKQLLSLFRDTMQGSRDGMLFPKLTKRQLDFGKEALSTLASALGRDLQAARDAFSQLNFFQKTLAQFDLDGGDGEENDDANPDEAPTTCPICLEEDFPPEQLSLTKCLHTFCTGCLTDALQNGGFHGCPKCRTPLKLTECQTVAEALAGQREAVERKKQKEEDKTREKKYEAFGSKINAVAEKCLEIKEADPTAKICVFVQFDVLRAKIDEAFTVFGFKHESLEGAAHRKNRVLSAFQLECTGKV